MLMMDHSYWGSVSCLAPVRLHSASARYPHLYPQAVMVGLLQLPDSIKHTTLKKKAMQMSCRHNCSV
jgi:hypothetical protein